MAKAKDTMRTEIYLAPSEIRYDAPPNLIGKMETPDTRNCTYRDGVRVKRFGPTQLGSNLALSGAVVGGKYFTNYAGTRFLVSATVDDIYKYNTTTGYWEIITNSTTLEACESGWTQGSGDTVTHDTDRVLGSKSMKVVLAAGRSENDLLAYIDISSADITAHNSIGFWVKSDTALSAGDLKVVVSESNHASGERTGTYTECDITALEADTWTFVRVAKTLTDYDAVISVSLFAGASLDSGLEVYLDDVRAYTPLTGDDDDFAEFDLVRDAAETDLWLIGTNGVDSLLKYTGSGVFGDLVSSYPSGVTSLTAKQLLVFKNHVHLFDVSENGNRYPVRVRWSDTAAPDDYLNGNASYQDLVSGGDWIKRAVLLTADTVAVLKTNSIWIGYATGGTDVFNYELQVPNLGTMAGRTAKVIRGSVFFLGWDDVYRFSGSEWTPIGRPIRKELLDGVNQEQIDRAFSFVIEDDNEYWLCVPMNGSTYCNQAFVYNYELGKWVGRHAYTLPLSAAGWYQRQANITIGELDMKIGEMTWKIGDKVGVPDSPMTVIGDANGYMYVYDRIGYNDDRGNADTAINAWFETQDIMYSALKTRQRLHSLHLYHEPPSTVTVQYSTDRGATWTTIDTVTATDEYTPSVLYVNLDARIVRFRFSNSTAGSRFAIREARMNWRPAGRRML